MPASHERVPNRPLSGNELKEIILQKVKNKLDRDGMFSQNLAYGRIAFEVRVSLHLDNPMYPLHISETISASPSDQEEAALPSLASLIAPPIEDETSEAIVISTEDQVKIASPNVARIEADLPLTIATRDMDTGQPRMVQQKFKGSMPDPEEVGNTNETVDTSREQSAKWKGKRK